MRSKMLDYVGMENYVGKRIDGRYEILEIIGVGGMAVVYKAHDNLEGRIVAVKILKKEYSNDVRAIRNFRNESRAIASMNHNNIVQIYDVSFGNLIQYIVMEYVDGINLKEYITQEGVIPINEAIYFIKQILGALQHAHDRAIIHRDVKPQNILLMSDGTIKVADFGIALMSRSETITKSTDLIGSMHYISPEQIRGGLVTSRSDIYSAGIVFYEMLTGKVPFEGQQANLLYKQMNEQPIKPSTLNPAIPYGLEQIVLRAMQKNPADRYQAATEMLVDIQRFQDDPAVIFNYSHLFVPSESENDEKEDDVREYTPKHVSSNNHAPRQQPNRQQQWQNNRGANASSRSRQAIYAESKRNAEKLKSEAEFDKKSTKKILISLLVVLVLLLGAAGAAYYYYSKSANMINVPNVIGMNYDSDIHNNSTYSMYNFEVEERIDNDADEGTVLDQNPKSGKIERGGVIKITVAKPAKSLTVPDVYGQDYTLAQTTLKAQNFKITIEKQASSSVEAGKVIKTSPARGSEIESGGTIILYVATGEEIEKVKVPNLIGMTMEEAKFALDEVGLELDSDRTEYRTSSEEKGTVIGYEHIDEEVEVGSAIAVYISSGYYTTTSSTSQSITESTAAEETGEETEASSEESYEPSSEEQNEPSSEEENEVSSDESVEVDNEQENENDIPVLE